MKTDEPPVRSACPWHKRSRNVEHLKNSEFARDRYNEFRRKYPGFTLPIEEKPWEGRPPKTTPERHDVGGEWQTIAERRKPSRAEKQEQEWTIRKRAL